MNTPENIIQIKLDFEKDSTDPQRIFDAMSDLIQSVQSLHSCVLSSVVSECRTELLLSDVTQGSLISWLTPEIKRDSSSIDVGKENKIAHFLNITTQIIIEFLEGKETISESAELDQLEDRIKKEATDLEEFPNVFSLDRQRLVKGLSSIGRATEELHSNDQAYIGLPTGNFPVNKNFNFSENEAKQLLSERVDHFSGEGTLIIKKADFLGNSMWDFILAGKKVPVKIRDKTWLDKFRHREEMVFPGDGLRCKYKVTTSYDKLGRIIEEKYEILKVKHKVNTTVDQQGLSFDE